ncbi:unnamed protein product [Prunus armeniaca]
MLFIHVVPYIFSPSPLAIRLLVFLFLSLSATQQHKFLPLFFFFGGSNSLSIGYIFYYLGWATWQQHLLLSFCQQQVLFLFSPLLYIFNYSFNLKFSILLFN